MKNKNGFTLIELLVAASLVGVISVVGVNLMFTTLISRSKQDSIVSVNEDIRNFVNILIRGVHDADSISVSSTSEVKITADICKTIKLAADGSIEYSEDNTAGCTPPTTGFTKITNKGTTVTSLNFSQNGKTLSYSIAGFNKDSLGEHSFNYNGKALQR